MGRAKLSQGNGADAGECVTDDELRVAEVRPRPNACGDVGEPAVPQVLGYGQPAGVGEGALVDLPEQPRQLPFGVPPAAPDSGEDLTAPAIDWIEPR
jgi:hypothetical protein